MSKPSTEQFIYKPNISEIIINKRLVDEIGNWFGKKLVEADLGEHQLRRIHEFIAPLYYQAKRLRLGQVEVLDDIITGIIRLQYMAAYQRSRIVKKKSEGENRLYFTRLYFDFFEKLARQLSPLTHENPQQVAGAVEILFYLSEAIIAYYNYHKSQYEEETI